MIFYPQPRGVDTDFWLFLMEKLMTKKISGMKNPMNTEMLRRVFGVLVVLLVASALLVGAGSAVETVTTYWISPDGTGTGTSDSPGNLTSTLKTIEDSTNTGTFLINVNDGTYDTFSPDESVTYARINQTEGKNIILDGGESVIFKGQLLVDGDSHQSRSETLLIKDITFDLSEIQNFYIGKNSDKTDASKPTAIYLMSMYDEGDTTSRYAHNILIQDCTFIGKEGTFALLASSGSSPKNISMIDSHVNSGNGLSLPCTNLTVKNNIIQNVVEGVNHLSGSNTTVEGNTIEGVQYTVRVGSSGVSGEIIIKDNVLNATNPTKANSHGTLVFRNALGDVTIQDNILKGKSVINNRSTSMKSFVAKENYFEGGVSDASRFTNIDVSKLNPYYTSLDDNGEIDKNSLVIILVQGTDLDGVTWESSNVKITKTGNYVSSGTGIIINASSVNGVTIDGNIVTEVKITGNTSVENGTTASNTLTADVGIENANVAYEVSWTVGTDGIIELGTSSDNGKTITYTPKKIGTTTLTAKAAGVEKTVTISVFGAATPNVEATATVDNTNGNVTLPTTNMVKEDGSSVSEGTLTDDTPVVIQDTNSGVNITVTYEAGATVSSSEIEGNVSKMEVTYPETPAESKVDATVAYNITLNLDADKALNGSIILPTIDPAFKADVAENIDAGVYNALSMITATTNVDAINGNLTENGITLTFTISMDAVTDANKIRVLHVDGTNPPTEAKILSRAEDTNNNVLIVKVQGSSFSSYVLAEYVYVAKDTTPSSGSSSSSGSSVWLTETPTQTPTPTPTETATPTDTVPTDIPSTQPTEEPSSPGFGVLAALAGLGCVAVLRRK